MSAQDLTAFSGVCGRVLWNTLSLRSLASGLMLGFVLFAGNFVFAVAQADVASMPFTQVIMALALARFVINGQYGEWTGTIFSAVGGTWADVLNVAVRYLTLTFVWLLPLILMGLKPQMMAAPMMMDKKMWALITLYLFGSMLTPPLMLIVSVAADSFADLFSARHWRSLFSEKWDDVFAVYAVYTGGVGMALILMAPLVILGFLGSVKLGIFLSAVAFCFLMGMSMNLLGRLCGFYSLGDYGTPSSSPETGRSGPAGAPDSGLSMDRFMKDAPPAVTPTAAPPPMSAAEEAAAAARPGIFGSPAAQATAAPEPADELPLLDDFAVPEAPPAEETSKRPPLMNANDQVESTLARFARDPTGAVTALEDLRDSYAPHPQVLWALCVCRQRMGETEKALELSGPALALCFERGHSQLAAELFKELRSQAGRLNLGREEILTIGAAATKKGDYATAGEAYSMVITKDAGEMRAVKGMIKIAELFAGQPAGAPTAAKIYRFLLQHCADTPLAEFIHRGLEDVERRLERTPAPA